MRELSNDEIRQVSGGAFKDVDGGTDNPFGKPDQCPTPPGWGTPWEGHDFS